MNGIVQLFSLCRHTGVFDFQQERAAQIHRSPYRSEANRCVTIYWPSNGKMQSSHRRWWAPVNPKILQSAGFNRRGWNRLSCRLSLIWVVIVWNDQLSPRPEPPPKCTTVSPRRRRCPTRAWRNLPVSLKRNPEMRVPRNSGGSKLDVENEARPREIPPIKHLCSLRRGRNITSFTYKLRYKWHGPVKNTKEYLGDTVPTSSDTIIPWDKLHGYMSYIPLNNVGLARTRNWPPLLGWK